jgi:hypothetical protein
MSKKKKKNDPKRGMFLKGVYKIESDTETEYGGFRGHFPHSKTGIFKKIVGAVFEKTRF